MAKEKRRSVYSDFSDKTSSNVGDQPLSPPSDTSIILAAQRKETPQPVPALNCRQFAKNIAFSFSDAPSNSSQISNDPYDSELAVTWNYHGGRKANVSPAPESQEVVLPTSSDVCENSSSTLQTAKNDNTQNQPTCVPDQFEQRAASFTKLQMVWPALSVLTTLGYLLVLTERLGLAHFSLLQGVGSFSILFSGLPGIFLACMCYAATVLPSKRKEYDAGSCSVSDPQPTALESHAKPQTEKNFDVFEAFHKLRAKSASNVLKTLLGFVLWDLVKAYTSFWPLLHLPLNVTYEPHQEPPFFGQSPKGAKAGIHGYPPRTQPAHALSLPFSPLCQLVFPLVADGSRLVGLWFAFKTMRHIQRRSKSNNDPASARQWLAGGSQALLLALFALPLALVLLHQSFWGSACMQPFTGLMPLVGEQATAFAGMLLRCHSFFLGLAAAFTGSILAAAFHGLIRTGAKSLSAILAALASLAFCSCILFDVLAAAVPSSSISCTYTPFIAEMRSGSVAVKAFAMAATISHQIGQICLSLSAVTVKVKDVVEDENAQENKALDASSMPAK